MRRSGLAKDRLFIYICSLYVTGMIFGIILLAGERVTVNSGQNFIAVFAANYWYLFLMWLFGFSVVGIFFNSLIIFFRGFLFGALSAILFPASLKHLVFLLLLEVLLFLPSFITLSYASLTFSLNLWGNRQQKMNSNFYLNIFLIVTIIIIIYSIIIAVYQV
jgi:hypothetical protein